MFAICFAALESLFTDDRRNISIQEQLKIRIPRIVEALSVNSSKISGMIEAHYTTRSKAVHGEYLGGSVDKVAQHIGQMEHFMQSVFKSLEQAIKSGNLDRNKKHLEFLKGLE